MGLGKFARGVGKVGLAFEALGYVWATGSALVKAIKDKRSDAPKDEDRSTGDAGDDQSGSRLSTD